MSALRIFFIILLLGLIGVGPSLALDQSVDLRTVSGGSSLQARQVYAVSVVCSPAGKDLRASRRSNIPFIGRNVTETLSVVLSSKRISSAADLSSIATQAISAMFIYSVNATEQIDNRRCRESFFISGDAAPSLIVIRDSSTTYTPSQAFARFESGLKLATPLLTLLSAGQLATAIPALSSNFEAIRNPFQAFLSTFNNANRPTMIEPLREGKFEFSTSLVKMTIEVRPISSLLLDGSTRFTLMLSQHLNTVNRALSEANIEVECRKVTQSMAELGVNSATDQGYVLVQLGLRAGYTKPKLIECLDRDQASAVARLSEKFWKGSPTDVRIRPEDIPPNYAEPRIGDGEQVAFDVASPVLIDLITGLGQLARNAEPPWGAMRYVEISLSERVDLVDTTSDLGIGLRAALAREDVPKILIDAGIKRFGCIRAITGATDWASDNAPAVLVGFRVPPDAREATADQAVLLRAIFKGRQVTILKLSKDRGGVTAALGTRKDCGELKIVDAKAIP